MGINMQKLMKQAQKMQQDMAKAQEELAQMEVEGTSGNGLVRVVMSAANEPLSVSISRDVVDPDDVEMLEDLVLVAIKSALEKAQETSAQRMAGLTGGMKMPGMF